MSYKGGERLKNIVGVRFKKTGKLYYVDINTDEAVKIGDNVLAETSRGQEIGRIVKILGDVNTDDLEMQTFIRIATNEDMKVYKQNEKRALEALEFCKGEAKKLNLNMKLLVAEYIFDASKLIIYFVAEDRVDFRELVKILASKYKTRIELRQIGPRDEIKVYPNLGMCGKEVCCRTYLQNFEPVTIKMAKEQGLQINMSKLSGACGKLMCCLKYEEDTYKQNLQMLPNIGDIVRVKGEKEEAKVIGLDALKLKVKVRFKLSKEEERFSVYPIDMIEWESNRG